MLGQDLGACWAGIAGDKRVNALFHFVRFEGGRRQEFSLFSVWTISCVSSSERARQGCIVFDLAEALLLTNDVYCIFKSPLPVQCDAFCCSEAINQHISIVIILWWCWWWQYSSCFSYSYHYYYYLLRCCCFFYGSRYWFFVCLFLSRDRGSHVDFFSVYFSFSTDKVSLSVGVSLLLVNFVDVDHTSS